MDAETVETYAGTDEEEINHAEDSIGDIEADLHEHLDNIMVKGRTGNDIMFKKVAKWFRRFKQIQSMKQSSI